MIWSRPGLAIRDRSLVTVAQLAALGRTDELKAHLKDRLVTYKQPKSYEFVDEPVRDDAGKVRRTALRDARIAAMKQPA